MDTSKDRAVLSDSGSPIRLRYSTQVQVEGRTHTIDAEIALPLGASQELREQIIRETELGVEQLARQLRQRANRSPEQTRFQTPSRADLPVSRPVENTRPPEEAHARPTSNPPVRTPISESMPATPTTRNDSKQITLPQFVNALNKHLHISRTEAMKLLRVDTLDGLNYWDAYKQLQALLARQASSQEPPAADKTRPIAREAAQPTLHRNEQQSQSASPAQSSASRPDPTRHEPTREPSPASRSEQQRHIVPSVPQETAREAASLSGGPHALQFSANSTRVPPPRALQFDEEEEEDFVIEDEADAYAYDDEDEEDEAYVLPIDREKERASAQLKLERLKGIRGSQAASPERLRVLDNLIDSQISEEQLQTMIQSIWGAATTKKLKNAQVEELISWAKEDFFVEEVEAMLKLMQETKE